MLSVFKPVAEKALQPIAHSLRHINPNLLSTLGLVFPIIFFICLVNHLHWLALLAFIFNGVDLLDGMVARATGKVTAFGGFLDSTIDRFADFVVIAAFGFAGIVGWNLLLPFLMLTYLISYMRSRIELAAKGELVANIGIIERTERLVAIFIALLLYTLFPHATPLGQNFVELIVWLLIVLSVVTVGQRTVFAYKKLS